MKGTIEFMRRGLYDKHYKKSEEIIFKYEMIYCIQYNRKATFAKPPS